MVRLRSRIVAASLKATMTACGLELSGLGALGVENDGGAPEASTPVADAADAEMDVSSTDVADAGADVTIDAGVPCTEADGKLFEGHCYFTLGARTQPQAKADCIEAGAHLVTVTSLPEHTFVGTVGTGDRWIGLEAASPTNDRNQYLWITGETKTVSYWYPNDPDNMGPCVAFRSELQPLESWVDRGCGESNVPICERQ